MRCPKCNRDYDQGLVVCPADGCVLIDVPVTGESEIGPTVISGRKPRPRAEPNAWGEAPEPDLVGEVLDGRYRVVAPLDSGGMGTVYVGEQLNVERRVAIKVLRRSGSADPARFRAEAKIISGLRHPSTVKLFDYGITADGVPYLVTELLRGEPLSTVLERGPVEPRRALRILREVSLSLDEAHAQGIIHRDLKPANIFLDQVGEQEMVKVLDFGIAKVSTDSVIAAAKDPRKPETLAGILIGTPAYISPEQASGKAVDARSDLYCLGAVGYHCLTGQLPFPGETIAQIAGHATLPVRRFAELEPPVALDARLEALVLRLLAKDPAERPQSARALADELEQLERALANPTPPPPAPAAPALSTAPTPPATPPIPAPPAKRSSPVLPALVLLLGVGLGAYALRGGLGLELPGETHPDAAALLPVAAPDAAALDAEGAAAALDGQVASSTHSAAPARVVAFAAGGYAAVVVETQGWEAQAITPTAKEVGAVLVRCHAGGPEEEAPPVRRVRFEVKETTSMEARPQEERFSSCLQLSLPNPIHWPPLASGTGVLELELGPE